MTHDVQKIQKKRMLAILASDDACDASLHRRVHPQNFQIDHCYQKPQFSIMEGF